MKCMESRFHARGRLAPWEVAPEDNHIILRETVPRRGVQPVPRAKKVAPVQAGPSTRIRPRPAVIEDQQCEDEEDYQ
jgi:hypothetical protein